MKTISLTQPWASLVASGVKRVETRSWQTSYRGPLAIHASASFPTWAKEACYTDELSAVLRQAFGADEATAIKDIVAQLPRGAVLATGKLTRMYPITEDFEKLLLEHYPLEWSLGNYASGRFAWYFARVRQLPSPVPAKGSLGLWEWEAR